MDLTEALLEMREELEIIDEAIATLERLAALRRHHSTGSRKVKRRRSQGKIVSAEIRTTGPAT